MENLYNFTLIEIVAFAMILLRMTAFVVSWPVFGTNLVPSPVKVLLALALTFILYPIVGYHRLPTNPGLEALVVLSLRELFIGVCLGFLSRLFFFAVGMAGQLISTTIGLSTAQLFNPAINEQSSALEQFHLILATLLFLAIQGHQMLLTCLAQSYDFAPLASGWISMNAFQSVGQLAQQIMLMGVQLSLPVMIAILFLNLAMAVIGRAVPQMNVLITSMPVNILVGIAVLFVMIPVLILQMDKLTHETLAQLFVVMKSF